MPLAQFWRLQCGHGDARAKCRGCEVNQEAGSSWVLFCLHKQELPAKGTPPHPQASPQAQKQHLCLRPPASQNHSFLTGGLNPTQTATLELSPAFCVTIGLYFADEGAWDESCDPPQASWRLLGSHCPSPAKAEAPCPAAQISPP